MIKRYVLLPLLAITANCANAQTDSMYISTAPLKVHKKAGSVYKIRPAIDIPIAVVTDAYSLFGMNKIYNRESTPISDVQALRVQDINSFDRPIAGNYDEKAKKASDMFFYGSMPAPLLLMLDKEIRKDGLKVGLLYLQAMGITGTLYTSSAMIANRYRPYVYNSNVSMDTRTRGGGRNSFFAGHPALVATSTFFMAKVFSDYHPDMKGKWALYTVAGGAAAATGLLRIKAGQHFKTDVITGVTVGTLSGILIPHFHKIRGGDSRVTYLPNFELGQTGMTVLVKIGQ